MHGPVREGSVFETERTVTVLEPGRRCITFYKNRAVYDVKLLAGVVDGNIKERGFIERTGKNASDGRNNCEKCKVDPAESSNLELEPEPRKQLKRDSEQAFQESRYDRMLFTDSTNEYYNGAGSLGEHVCDCFGILGIVKFTEGYYLVLVTEAVTCGRLLLEHDVYTIRDKTLVPLFYPCSNRYIEKYYRNMFNQFDIADHFYFSYDYNMCHSLQLNRMYARCEEGDRDWLDFDTGMVTQKFRYNFSHTKELGDYLGEAASSLCLNIIHGFFGQVTMCFSGRNVVLHLIARRSRFYAGTRYRKRGITAKGHVANDVETEQIVEDVTCDTSVFSFVQIRGSTPIFWAQDANQNIMKKPALSYPQMDPTFTSTRLHISDLMCLYGAPLIMLNLLSDDPLTEEGQLSQRYEEAILSVNADLPPEARLQYINRNIRGAFERGCVKQMVSEIIHHAAKELGYYHERRQHAVNLQVGVLRASCLDCLDRTSVVALQLGLLVFQKHLSMLGIHVQNCDVTYVEERPSSPCYSVINSEELGSKCSWDPVLELFRNMFEQLGDAIALQYAGSRTLRKYEGSGGAFSMSLQLLTTIQRRYHSHFADSERQTLSNIFLGILKADRHPPPWSIDVDNYIHHQTFQCGYNSLDWWVVPLTCYLKRAKKMEALVRREWFERFDEAGEYRPWAALSAIFAARMVVSSAVAQGPALSSAQAVELPPARQKSDSEPLEMHYTFFDYLHSGKVVQVNRPDEDGSGTITALISGRGNSCLVDLLSPTSERQETRGRYYQTLGIKEPDIEAISLYLEPWNIGTQEDIKLHYDMTRLNCRDKDREYYEKFVRIASLG